MECGADAYVASSERRAMRAARASLDLILNFVPSLHRYSIYADLLAPRGKMVLLGVHAAWAAAMFRGGARAPGCCKGSFIGGLRNTQELMELCDTHQIYPHTTLRPVHELNDVLQQLDSSNESGTRYVLDVRRTLTNEAFEACSALAAPKLSDAAGGMDTLTVARELLFMKCFMHSR